MAKQTPFLVNRSSVREGQWCLYMRLDGLVHKGYFDSQAEAIDYAYRNWPWWP